MDKSSKMWAIANILTLLLMVAGIIVTALDLLKFDMRFAVLIPVIILSWIWNCISFFKMQYDLGNWDDMFELFWLFVKFLLSVFGGAGIWGIVVAIKILADKD